MKQLLLCVVIILAMGPLSAQQRVVLESNGTTTVFGGIKPFVDAYAAAVAGDVIYLPGTTLTAPAQIDKGVTIYGVGHYPAATSATNKTIINGHLMVTGNADNLVVEGCEINGNLIFSTNEKVDNVVISRCKFIQLNYQGTNVTPCENHIIKQCIITSSLYLNNANSCLLSNNIFGSTLENSVNNNIKNNVFLYNSSSITYGTLRNVDNSTISNNIFRKENYMVHSSCESSTFENNVYLSTPTVGANVAVNNYLNIVFESLFVEQANEGTFSYDQDYHLNSPGTYLGEDGTQVGIYGGLFPYKENAVPQTPHISEQSIATATDESGLLNISITVTAQQE